MLLCIFAVFFHLSWSHQTDPVLIHLIEDLFNPFFFQQNFIITAVAFLLNKIVKKKSSEIIVSQEITNNYYRWDFFSCFFHFKSCSYFFRFCIENVEFSALARCCFILLEAFFNRKKQNLLSAIWPINRITTFKRFLKVFKSRWLILNVKAIKKTIFNC